MIRPHSVGRYELQEQTTVGHAGHQHRSGDETCTGNATYWSEVLVSRGAKGFRKPLFSFLNHADCSNVSFELKFVPGMTTSLK